MTELNAHHEPRGNIRLFEEADYPMLCKWWDGWNCPRITLEILPATGYICNDAAAAFLYLANAPIARLAWSISDPKADKKKRSEAIDQVTLFVESQAKKAGALMIYTTTNSFPFCERLKRLGFAEGDRKTTHFAKVL